VTEESSRFLKKAVFCEFGPVALKPHGPKVNKVFLLLFVHKKKRFLALF
jgi:hypothetical protein